jgi:hypothetical protein
MKFSQQWQQAQTDGRRLRPNRHVKHERFPSITFPAETMLETGMRFLFFRRQLQNTVLLVFFSANAKVAEYSSSRNCRLKAMQGTRFESFGHRLRRRPSLAGSFRLAGAAFSVGAFNRKGQEPDSRFAHF